MKDLIIKKDNRRIKTIQEIIAFEREKKVEIPDLLKQLLLKYEGCKTDMKCSYYKDDNGNFHEVGQFLFLRKSEIGGASIETIMKGHRLNRIEGFIPFAIDSGGSDYNLSIRKESFGEVWVNKFNIGVENTMYSISSSLEEFINELGAKE
jgi:hypothetical protein